MTWQEEIRELGNRNNGEVDAEVVVAHAAKTKGELHEQFEWDDAAAGHACRIEKARKLIRAVHVEIKVLVEHEPPAPNVLPGFLRDPRKDYKDRGYLDITKIRRSNKMAKKALLYEVERVISVVERCVRIAEFLRLDGELQDIVKRLEAVRDGLR